MSAVSMRTTTVKYQTKPQAAVQYEIALLSGALVYNPNQSDKIEGRLEWRVYKIEGDQRLPMSNKQEGMACRCGYSDAPGNNPGINTTDNVTFNDDGAAQVAYNSNSTKQFTIIYGSITGSVFTQLARLDVPVNVIGKDAAVVASIDFDNNNATLLYNSSKGVYANSAVANVSLLVGGEDKSNTATITFKSHDVNGAITRGGETTFIKPDETPVNSPNRTGIISVKATSLAEGKSFGYITATYTDSSNIKYTATFNVTRSVGRYAVEIIATPTQISYNQTTGIASSSKVVAKINAIDINGKKTDGAAFSTFGAMEWRYIGGDWTTYVPDPNSGQSASVLEIKNLDFTKSGVEFSFVDGSGNQLDYETVPFSSVTNGGDAFLVNVASMNVAVVLTSISYGAPTGDATNVVYMTKNNAVLPSGVRYDVPGDDGEKYALATDSDTANVSYNGWLFNYSYQEGRLKSSLVRVEENSPTSVHIPIDVKYPTDNITRTVMISYSAIQKGPAGRSYKPNTPELYDPKKKYVWNDERRDFIYYAFNVNEKGEQDDEKGVLSYFQYGVKKYDNNGSVSVPPEFKGGDDNWELVSEYKSIIVNCLFGTNAVLGGMVFTAQTQTSEGKNDKGEANIIIDGAKGKLIANDAIIRGEVNATGGTFDKCIIKDTCTITKIKATKGTIGGFEINGASIGKSDGMSAQKGMSLFGDFICFNDNDANGTYQRQAVLGTTSYLGSKFLMRLIDNASSYDDHTGIVFDIRNSLWNKNHAFCGNGDGVLNGVIQGYKLNVMTSGLINISKGNTVYCNGGSSNYLVLPTLANCKDVLGTDGAFALDLTIIGASGARDFRVYGKRHNSTTDCYLLNNDHGDDWYATMSQGDVLTLKLIYTGSAFYAYIVSSMQ